MASANDYLKHIEVLSWNSRGGHNFYVVTVKSEEEGLLHLAILPGNQRWNKRLADALVGGGYFIGEQYAREAAEKSFKEYNDFDPANVEIKLLDIDEAITCLQDAAEEVRKEVRKMVEENKNKPSVFGNTWYEYPNSSIEKPSNTDDDLDKDPIIIHYLERYENLVKIWSLEAEASTQSKYFVIRVQSEDVLRPVRLRRANFEEISCHEIAYTKDFLYVGHIGFDRWQLNKRLAHAIENGNGLFNGEEYARKMISQLCKTYKDLDAAKFEIKPLGLGEAISCIQELAEERRLDIQVMKEERKNKQNARSCH